MWFLVPSNDKHHYEAIIYLIKIFLMNTLNSYDFIGIRKFPKQAPHSQILKFLNGCSATFQTLDRDDEWMNGWWQGAAHSFIRKDFISSANFKSRAWPDGPQHEARELNEDGFSQSERPKPFRESFPLFSCTLFLLPVWTRSLHSLTLHILTKNLKKKKPKTLM